LTVLLGWFTESQSFKPRALVCATISESNKPVGPASLSTWKQMPLIVPAPMRFSTSSSVSVLRGFAPGLTRGFFLPLAAIADDASFCFFFFWLDSPAATGPSADGSMVPGVRCASMPVPGAVSQVTTPSLRFVAVTPVRPSGPFSHFTV
jgi:hypothetical protein